MSLENVLEEIFCTVGLLMKNYLKFIGEQFWSLMTNYCESFRIYEYFNSISLINAQTFWLSLKPLIFKIAQRLL